LVRATDS